jgi:fluoride ion exporter CrcB/FEX
MRFCTAADFFAFVSALFASSFASSFAFAALIVNSFAALIVNSFAVSSASKDSWRKFLHATRSRGIYHVRKYSNTL